ncbi:calcium-binding and coiled-coil domain-containing protein 2-like isoform X2 [Heptranchias perlo]|uniref:calcium-binding and coiled-coil domain-containing protein 2-like isoform X2 n=1 Tax=Heptranchias perlo TaxID=212740 RepID=UPI00355A16D0
MNESQGEPHTDTSSLYSSTFAQVIFVNVEKLYMTDTPVRCNYTLTPRINPHKKDWIGIFKVGWSTARDYHTFVWSPLPKEDSQVERQQQVTFEAYYLPKDNIDFYQFCYVTQKGEIRGASTPFGFRLTSSSMSENLDSDSSQEMLIITTQDKLEETEREKDELKDSNLRLMEENATLKKKIEELDTQAQQDKEEHSAALEMNKKDMMTIEKQMLEQKVDNEVETRAQSEKVEQLRKELTEKEAVCSNTQKENQDLLAKMGSAQATVEQSKQKYEKAVDKVKQLKQETETLKMEISTKETKLTSLSETKHQIENELRIALDKLELVQFDFDTQKKENEKLTENLKKMAEIEIQMQNHTAEIDHLRRALCEYEKLKATNRNSAGQLQEQVENLRHRLKATEEQLQLAQQRQLETTAELRAAEADREKSDASLRDAHQDILHWRGKFEKLEQIFSKSEVRFTEIERQLEDKTHIVDVRTMEVAALQEEIKKLNKKIDDLMVGTNHQSGAFQLEHPNPYSLTVPKVHSRHSGLVFGNPYSDCAVKGSQTGGSIDFADQENSQDIEEEPPADSQKCPVCEVLFPLNLEDFDFEQHVLKHFVYECPVCETTFPEIRQTAYEDHVQSHFMQHN